MVFGKVFVMVLWIVCVMVFGMVCVMVFGIVCVMALWCLGWSLAIIQKLDQWPTKKIDEENNVYYTLSL